MCPGFPTGDHWLDLAWPALVANAALIAHHGRQAGLQVRKHHMWKGISLSCTLHKINFWLLTFQTQHLELTYIWICPKLGSQNGHISGENDWDFGAPYQTDPSVNCRILLLLLTPQPREERTCHIVSHMAWLFGTARGPESKSDPGLPILILSHTPNP